MIREICIVAVMVAVAAGGYLLSAGTDMPEAYVFPRTVIYVMFAMAAIQLVESLITAKKTGSKTASAQTGPFPWIKVAMALACVLIYFASMEAVGFYVSGFLFFLGTTLLLQKEKITPKNGLKRALSAGVFMVTLFVLFHVILAVQTPKGVTM